MRLAVLTSARNCIPVLSRRTSCHALCIISHPNIPCRTCNTLLCICAALAISQASLA